MKLLDNWKDVLQMAWSVKLAAISSFFIFMSQVMAYVPTEFLTTEQSAAVGGALGSMGGLFAALVIVARAFDQGLAKAEVVKND